MITIRPMEETELERVLALWNEACVEAVGHELTEKSAKLVSQNLRQYALHDNCHCLVCSPR